MQATFKVKAGKLKQFQDLVKAYNFRFIGNPYIYNGQATVCIDGSHLLATQCNEFFAVWNRMNTTIREVPKKTVFQRLVKRVESWVG